MPESVVTERGGVSDFGLTDATLSAENRALHNQIDALIRRHDAALSEMRHRVLNQFQILASLIGLHLRQAANQDSRDLLSQVHDYVLALGTLQKQIDSEGGRHFGRYLDDLAATWRTLYKPRGVDLSVDADDIDLATELAAPLALITNELVTNCCKHAFPEGGGRIRISLRLNRGGQAELIVADNGIGMPRIWSGGSLGIELIKRMASQMGADLSFEAIDGTTVRLRFAPGGEVS